MATAPNLPSFNGLAAHKQRLVREALRNEFADFFIGMTTASDEWPAIPDQEFVDALSDALLMMGKHKKVGTALLQTLVYELQDRVNSNL